MLRSLALGVAGVLLVIGGLLRTRAYLSAHRPETGYIAGALGSLGIAMLLNVAPIATHLDQDVWHVNNLAILLSHLLVVVTAWAGIEMFATAAGWGRRGRDLRWWVAAGVGGGMTLTFLLAGPLPETPLFFERYGRDYHLAAYWILFIGAGAAATAYLATVAFTHTRHDDAWLRRGLRLIGVGSALNCAFFLSRLVVLAVQLPSWSEPAAIALLTLGTGTLGAGAVTPQVAATWSRHRARRDLYPIWLEVTAPYPQVREATAPSSLYRTMIEIHDALAEARAHDALKTPLMVALDQLPPRSGDEVDRAVEDLCQLAATMRPAASA